MAVLQTKTKGNEMTIDISVSEERIDTHKCIESGLKISIWESADLIERLHQTVRDFVDEKDSDMQDGRRVEIK